MNSPRHVSILNDVTNRTPTDVLTTQLKAVAADLVLLATTLMRIARDLEAQQPLAGGTLGEGNVARLR